MVAAAEVSITNLTRRNITYTLDEAYDSIKKFNIIAGTLKAPTLETLDLYNSLSFEECCESVEAFETQDAPNVLKEAIDEFYVICGKLQVLEAMGMNVAEGLRMVCENNLQKFTPAGKPLSYDNNHTVTFNEEFQMFVLKNADGKVVKPCTYKKVDLKGLVPNNFFQKGNE